MFTPCPTRSGGRFAPCQAQSPCTLRPMTSRRTRMTRARATCSKALQAGACLCLCAGGPAWPDGMRCGTRLVVSGDPVSRLLQACGEPRSRIKARADVGRRGAAQEVPVTQWIYPRAGRADMIVSIRHGRVVKIERG